MTAKATQRETCAALTVDKNQWHNAAGSQSVVKKWKILLVESAEPL